MNTAMPPVDQTGGEENAVNHEPTPDERTGHMNTVATEEVPTVSTPIVAQHVSQAQAPVSLPEDPRGVLTNALALAAAGHPILPCYTINGGGLCTCYGKDKKTGDDCRSGKHPIEARDFAPHGLDDATTDPEVITEWFKRRDGKINFGWRCDRLGVADIDTADGKTGVADAEALQAEHEAFAATLRVRTGRGGIWHVYELPAGVDTKRYADKLVKGSVDFKRGAGHYVMVPGSKTEDVYTIESGDLLTHEPLPTWLHDLAIKLGSHKPDVKPGTEVVRANGDSGPALDDSSWEAVDGWLKAGTKSGDAPDRGNSNAASFVGGIVRDIFKSGQGKHVAMRLALQTERVSDDPQHPSIITDMVERFWAQEEEKQAAHIDRIVSEVEAGADPAELLARLEESGSFKEEFRKRLVFKLADKKAADTIAGKTGESELEPEPEDPEVFLNAEPPGWQIEGLWPKGAYGVVAAPKKAGKTWMAMDMAIAVAAGVPWLGNFPCQRGRVVYALGEGSRFAALQRIRAICEFHGVDHEALIRDRWLIPVLQPVQITNAKHLQRVRDWMDEYEPSLLVIDPFYLSQGSANGTNLAEMGETLREIQVICNSRGCSLMFVHHFKKGSASGTDQMTGVGLGEWARVIGVAEIESETRIERGTAVSLKVHFSGEMAPTSFAMKREVWTDDPARQDAPQHYSVRVKSSGGALNEGKLELTDAQGLLFDAITAKGKATPAAVWSWLEEHKLKRGKLLPSANSVKEALRRFREKRPDLVGFREFDSTVEYYALEAEAPTLE